jgi:hypothetical protein
VAANRRLRRIDDAPIRPDQRLLLLVEGILLALARRSDQSADALDKRCICLQYIVSIP